ncbi:hypothetical protein I79_016233 [Cricetulus griseus]|uniref:Uncharacterized protein n=1 Tax=Cricetulus griseus TaxID=10029 RepID=G3HYU1_CRIGR|nr:hypothetical protein I79_016233 [Cricetulus griseus]
MCGRESAERENLALDCRCSKAEEQADDREGWAEGWSTPGEGIYEDSRWGLKRNGAEEKG